jgi:urease accessory protein
MTWLSPAYPIGAFSYSSGIEWAVEAEITDASTLERWLAVVIGEGGGFCDAVFFVHAYRAAACNDDTALRAVAELAAVFSPSKERHLETTAQGRAFLDHACGVAGAGARSTAGGLGWRRCVAGRGRGRECRTRYCPRARAARLSPRHDGKRHFDRHAARAARPDRRTARVATLEPVATATAARAITTPLDQVGEAASRADLASMRDQTQYTRLFRS